MSLSTLVFIFVLFSYANSCITIYDGINTLKSTQISYLYHRNENVEQIDLHGFIITNWNTYEPKENMTKNNDLVFVLHRITQVDYLGGIDVSKTYFNALNDNYDGILLSSSDRKLPGEIMYFYYNNDSFVDIYKFEINELFLIDVMEMFPDGAYFDIYTDIESECKPYYNYWKAFYQEAPFHIAWTIQVIVASCIVYISVLILFIKWKYLMTIFKICLLSYILSSIIRVFYGVNFMWAKTYQQGPLVFYFQVSDIIGGLGSLSLSMAGFIVYICFWQLTIDIKIRNIDFRYITKIVAIIAAIIMCVLAIFGIMLLILAESAVVYYICYIYFVILLIVIIIIYIYTDIQLSKTFRLVKGKGRGFIKKLNLLFIIQTTCLILIVILYISTIYLITPFQSSIFVCFVHILLGIIKSTHLYLFSRITDNDKGTSTSKNNKSIK